MQSRIFKYTALDYSAYLRGFLGNQLTAMHTVEVQTDDRPIQFKH